MLDVDYLRGGPAEHTSDHQHAAQRRGAPAGRGLPGEACSADHVSQMTVAIRVRDAGRERWQTVRARSAGAIPLRYGSGMTIQMTVRLPDDVASYIDERVSEGAAGSRAEMIARAVRHERELEILAALRDRGETLYPDLAGLVDWAAERPLDLE